MLMIYGGSVIHNNRANAILLTLELIQDLLKVTVAIELKFKDGIFAIIFGFFPVVIPSAPQCTQ